MRIRSMTINDFHNHGDDIERWAADVGNASEGEFTAEELMQAIERGTHTPWAWTNDAHELRGMFVTTPVMYGDGRCLAIVGAAGDCMEAWDEFTELSNELAKQLNCSSMEMRGRKGLIRKFKDSGWKEAYTVLKRPVLTIPGSYLKASGE